VPEEVNKDAARLPDAKKLNVLADLKKLVEILCPETPARKSKAKSRLSRLNDPAPDIGLVFPANPTHGQPCYATGSSNRPDLAHRVSFQDAGGTVVSGYFSVYFMFWASWMCFMIAPPAPGNYYLCVEAFDGTDWVGEYCVPITVI
jgi:hypothetical protein